MKIQLKTCSPEVQNRRVKIKHTKNLQNTKTTRKCKNKPVVLRFRYKIQKHNNMQPNTKIIHTHTKYSQL